MFRIGASAALSALAISLGGVARAAEPSGEANLLPVELEFSDCAALDQRELSKLLAVEFQTLGVQRSQPAETVRVACGPSAARVSIDASRTVNEVELASTPRAAWPRLLALSISEIVIEARARVAPQPPRPQPAIAAPKPVPPAPSAPASERRVRLYLGGTLRRAVRAESWLAGPELGVEYDWSRSFTLAADVRAEFGSSSTDVAEVRWSATRGALLALLGTRVNAWRLSLGPGLCLGYLRWSPTVNAAGTTGHALGGVWGGPELVARAHYDFSERWFALASVDSGIVTWPVRGLVDGERRLLDSGGAWLSGGLALGALF